MDGNIGKKILDAINKLNSAVGIGDFDWGLDDRGLESW